jgi:hypothetical protein
MSISAAQTTVGTSATLVAQNTASDSSEGDYRERAFVVKNITASSDIFLGDSAVTTSNGFKWSPADGPLFVKLEPSESLYGVVASISQTVHSLRSGR